MPSLPLHERVVTVTLYAVTGRLQVRMDGEVLVVKDVPISQLPARIGICGFADTRVTLKSPEVCWLPMSTAQTPMEKMKSAHV